MADTNPYEAPHSDVEVEPRQGYADINVFSAEGRIGRLRYLAFLFLISIVYYGINLLFLGGMAAGGGGALMVGSMIIFAGVAIAVLVISMFLAIQRLHDINKSGWWILLFIVPLLNLILMMGLWFVSGTDGENDYGLQPPPNPLWVKILGFMFPLLMILGILAALVVPSMMQPENFG